MSHHCSCEFKERMIAELLDFSSRSDSEEAKCISVILSSSSCAENHPACCMLAFMMYYGYCEECTRSLSEEARIMIEPLMHYRL